MTGAGTYISLGDIRTAEKRKQLFKGFLTPVFIRTTAQQSISGMYKIPYGIYEKDFRPSWFRKGLILVFLLTFSFPLIELIMYWKKDPIIYSLVLIALSVLFGFLAYDGFFNKKKNYLIHLDSSGISIGETFYNWSSIQQTAILEIGAGRGQHNYLVLVFNDGSYRKYLLQSFLTFWGFRSSLSAYIEYFKGQHQKD